MESDIWKQLLSIHERISNLISAMAFQKNAKRMIAMSTILYNTCATATFPMAAELQFPDSVESAGWSVSGRGIRPMPCRAERMTGACSGRIAALGEGRKKGAHCLFY